MSASQPGASSSTDVGVVVTWRFTGVPKSSDGALAHPPAISAVAIRPTSSRRSPNVEGRAQTAREISRLVAELGRGLGRRAPIRDPDRRLRDLPEVIGKAHGARERRWCARTESDDRRGDLEARQAMATEAGGDLHRVAQLHVLAGEVVRLADPPS